jgi:alpha-N-arabinofuranosidase
MANLAQTINVLQSVMLTKGEQMILTPTYYVMEMYKVHQDATLIPAQVTSTEFVVNGERLQAVTASASKDKAGKIHISLTNIDNKNSQQVEIQIGDLKPKQVTGRILTSAKIQDMNSFENPQFVTPKEFKDAKLKDGMILVNMPANSVIVLEL